MHAMFMLELLECSNGMLVLIESVKRGLAKREIGESYSISFAWNGEK
jgi:hypothetical protein